MLRLACGPGVGDQPAPDTFRDLAGRCFWQIGRALAISARIGPSSSEPLLPLPGTRSTNALRRRPIRGLSPSQTPVFRQPSFRGLWRLFGQFPGRSEAKSANRWQCDRSDRHKRKCNLRDVAKLGRPVKRNWAGRRYQSLDRRSVFGHAVLRKYPLLVLPNKECLP